MGNCEAIRWESCVNCAKMAKAGMPPPGPAPGPGPGPAGPPGPAAPGGGSMGGVAMRLFALQGLSTHDLEAATLATPMLLANILPTMGHVRSPSAFRFESATSSASRPCGDGA